MKHAVCIPAVTVILTKPGDPNLVVVVKFREKHKRCRGLPGGRINFEREHWLTAAVRDAAEEETGLIVDPSEVRTLPIVEGVRRDVRPITAFKYLHGGPDRPEVSTELKDVEYEGHYMDLVVCCAPGYGTPRPKDEAEIESVEFVPLEEAVELPLILDFGAMLKAYQQILLQFPNPLSLPRPIKI